ncbi:distal tail protein Dit [Halalkalibacterium halodurans]|uniref:distal tail protein Dit n=1 Tax=Halalkalibacterium halodurans TaxID=86665 RepID=UPI0010FDD408|nr:distal tail protein Dit [Halalkalibacterium halodurans]
MIYNGIKKDYVRVNMDLYRPPTPPIEFITAEKPKGGDRVRRKRYRGMELNVPITIRSDRRIEELKQELSEWLVHDEPKKLEFLDMPDRYYLAYYQGMELNEHYKYAKGVISFYLPEGYRFGADNEINVTASYTAHIIKGQDQTPWTTYTRFTAPHSQYTLETNKGLYVLLNYSFIEGDILRIDYSKREVTLNNKDLAVSVSLNTNWTMLQPGAVQVRASEPTTVTYTERYY